MMEKIKKKYIDIPQRFSGEDFLGINTLVFSNEKHKKAGLFYEDIDVIYIKRKGKGEDIFKTIIKTKKCNKLVFKFSNATENLNFHKKIIKNYKDYLKEKEIKPYHIHSLITNIENVEIVESKIKKRKSNLFSKNKEEYDEWDYELIVIKTKFGNKATTEMYHYEDNLRIRFAIGFFSDKNYNK